MRPLQKLLAAVGFEPTPPKRLVPKTSALDHSATLPYGFEEKTMHFCHLQIVQVVCCKITQIESCLLLVSLVAFLMRRKFLKTPAVCTGFSRTRRHPFGVHFESRIQVYTQDEYRLKLLGSGGIRTHASEETGALNQRLRPLGHATLAIGSGRLYFKIIYILFTFSEYCDLAGYYGCLMGKN